MSRLSNKDVKKKGYPKELIYDGIRTNVWYSPKRKKNTDDHWTAYINDKNTKHSWKEIGKERNFQKAEPLVKQKAVDYYLKNYDIPKNKPKKKEKKQQPFNVSEILKYYVKKYSEKKRQQVKDGEKLKSVVDQNISAKESNQKIIDGTGEEAKKKNIKGFGHLDLRDITDEHLYNFMKSRNVDKSTIGNNLAFFGTALNYKLERLANETRNRTSQPMKLELQRVITVIKIFRKDNKLRVKDALKRAKAKKANGHGRILYGKFKEIIQWIRDNPEMENTYADFFEFLFYQSNRIGEGNKLMGKHIIIHGDNIKLDVPPILTKDNRGGRYYVHPDIEAMLKQRLKDNIKPDEPIFLALNKTTGKKQRMTKHYYYEKWRDIKIEFDLKLNNGEYMTPHILRHSAVNNFEEAKDVDIKNVTRQTDEIIKHYLEDETVNVSELKQLIAWEEKEIEKLKEKTDKEIGRKGVDTFFRSDKQKKKNDSSIFEL